MLYGKAAGDTLTVTKTAAVRVVVGSAIGADAKCGHVVLPVLAPDAHSLPECKRHKRADADQDGESDESMHG